MLILSSFKVKILFSGSENEVGVAPRVPVNETFQDNPVTIFGIHKLMAEKYLQYYSREFGMQTVTLRLSNVYGPTSRRDRAVQVVLKMEQSSPVILVIAVINNPVR